MADTGQPPPVPLQALDWPVIAALAVAAFIGLVWVFWQAQSKD